jgi:MFS family permease
VFSLAAATAFAGLAHLGLMVGGQTMVALKAPKSEYNKLFGYYTFSASLGQMIGPVVAGLLAGSLANGLPKDSSNAFIFAIALSTLALIPTFAWRKSAPSVQASESQSNTWAAAKSMLSRKEISLAVFISLAISTTGDLLVIFLPLLGTEREIDPALIGLILSLRALGSMISRFSLGYVSKRINDRNLLLATTTVAAIALAFMVYTSNPLILGALVFISGLMLGFGQPLTMAIVSHRTKPDERALAISARLTGNRLGQFLLPIIAGLLTSAGGAGAAFWSMAGLLSLGFLAASSD